VHRDPYVVYPGSTQGRNIKETGEKGAYLVTVRDGKVVSAEFFVTGPILWAEEEVNITGMDLSSLLEGMRIRSGSFVRLRITGQGALDRMIRFEQRDFIRAVESYRKCRVVGIEVRSIPDIDINERRRTGDFTSAVINEADRMFDMSKEEIISAICMTKASQSPDIRRVFERMSETELREMVNDARASLLERLLGGSI
jgi:DNA repair exonuclease SbcCD nuclease subunit